MDAVGLGEPEVEGSTEGLGDPLADAEVDGVSVGVGLAVCCCTGASLSTIPSCPTVVAILVAGRLIAFRVWKIRSPEAAPQGLLSRHAKVGVHDVPPVEVASIVPDDPIV